MFGFVKRKIEAIHGIAIEQRVRTMVLEGRDFAVFDDVAYDTARSYAEAKGAKAADAQSASARIAVGGETYFVVFARAFRGGTSFGVEKAQDVRVRVLDRAKMETHVAGQSRSAFDGFSAADRCRAAELLIVKDIQEGVVRRPNWTEDEPDLTTLLDAAGPAAERGGMDRITALHWLARSDVVDAILTAVARFEAAGFDRPGQIANTCAFVEKLAKAQLKAQAQSPK